MNKSWQAYFCPRAVVWPGHPCESQQSLEPASACIEISLASVTTNLGRFSIVKNNYRKIIIIGLIIGSGKIDSLGRIESMY